MEKTFKLVVLAEGPESGSANVPVVQSREFQVKFNAGNAVCPPGHVLGFFVTDPLMAICELCGPNTYSLLALAGPDAPVFPGCYDCPAGATCKGGTSFTALSGTWEVRNGRFEVVGCPSGHRMVAPVQKELYSTSRCEPCPPGSYIQSSSDSSLTCLTCPSGARCRRGNPPIFDLVVVPVLLSLRPPPSTAEAGPSASYSEAGPSDSSSYAEAGSSDPFPEAGPSDSAYSEAGPLSAYSEAGPSEARHAEAGPWAAVLSPAQLDALLSAFARDAGVSASDVVVVVTCTSRADCTRGTWRRADQETEEEEEGEQEQEHEKKEQEEEEEEEKGVIWVELEVTVGAQEVQERLNHVTLPPALEAALRAAGLNRTVVLALDREGTRPLYPYGTPTWVPCEGGRYCLRSCPPGHLLVNTTSDLQECVPCEPATYTLSYLDGCPDPAPGEQRVCHTRSCRPCPKGAASCDRGYTLQPHVNQSVWREETARDGTATVWRLVECPAGYILSRQGSEEALDECSPCPPRSYSVESALAFPSDPAYPDITWGESGEAKTDLPLCLPCPFSAYCDGGSSVVANSGYWRGTDMSCKVSAKNRHPHNCQPLSPYEVISRRSDSGGDDRDHVQYRQSARIYRCRPRMCLGGNECRVGHTGVACALCLEGWAMEEDGTCTECKDGGQGGWVTRYLLPLVGALAALKLYYVMAWQPLLSETMPSARSFKAVACTVSFFMTPVSKFLHNIWAMIREEKDYIKTVLKILISFLQVLGSFLFTLEVDWPDSLTSLMHFADWFRVFFFSLPTISCFSGRLSPIHRLALSTLLPIGILVLLAIPSLYVSIAGRLYYGGYREHPYRERVISRFYQSTMIAVFLLYPAISSTVLRVFNCVDYSADGIYLRHDQSVACDSDQYRTLWWWALVFTVVYPIGIPVWMLYAMRREGIAEMSQRKGSASRFRGLLQLRTEQLTTHARALIANAIGWSNDENEVQRRISFLYSTGLATLLSDGENLQPQQVRAAIALIAEVDEHTIPATDVVDLVDSFDPDNNGLDREEVEIMLREIMGLQHSFTGLERLDQLSIRQLRTLREHDWALPTREFQASEDFTPTSQQQSYISFYRTATSHSLLSAPSARPPSSPSVPPPPPPPRPPSPPRLPSLPAHLRQNDSTPNCTAQISPTKAGTAQIGTAQIGTAENGTENKSFVERWRHGVRGLGFSKRRNGGEDDGRGQKRREWWGDSKERKELVEWIEAKGVEMRRGNRLSEHPVAWKDDGEHREVQAIERLGFLFLTYTVECWWFEVLVMINKLLVTSIVAFAYPGSPAQVAVGFVLNFGFLLIVLVKKPFVNRKLLILQACSLVAHCLTLFFGLTLLTAKFMAAEDNAGTETSWAPAFIVTVNILVILLPIFQLIVDYKQFVVRYQGMSVRLARMADATVHKQTRSSNDRLASSTTSTGLLLPEPGVLDRDRDRDGGAGVHDARAQPAKSHVICTEEPTRPAPHAGSDSIAVAHPPSGSPPGSEPHAPSPDRVAAAGEFGLAIRTQASAVEIGLPSPNPALHAAQVRLGIEAPGHAQC